MKYTRRGRGGHHWCGCVPSKLALDVVANRVWPQYARVNPRCRGGAGWKRRIVVLASSSETERAIKRRGLKLKLVQHRTWGAGSAVCGLHLGAHQL